MAHVSDIMDVGELTRMIKERYITERFHPKLPLRILNYTPRTQYERVWTTETRRCRGLILDKGGIIVGRCMEKFFNWAEMQAADIPAEPFEVYDKLDGSLFIVVKWRGQLVTATRGSFDSEQAREGNAILAQQYGGVEFPEGFTHLCEVIYPGNRIVVDYRGLRDVILLSCIETATGREVPASQLVHSPLPRVRQFDGLDLDAVRTIQDPEREGFVIRFESGLRVKVKFEEYCRLHRILTNITARNLYEYLAVAAMRGQFDTKAMARALFMNPEDVALIAAAPDPFAEILERVPDEFHRWVEEQRQQLVERYAAIVVKARHEFADSARVRPDRKTMAAYFQTCETPAPILFKMLDGRPYADAVWRMIRPEHVKPFRRDDA